MHEEWLDAGYNKAVQRRRHLNNPTIIQRKHKPREPAFERLSFNFLLRVDFAMSLRPGLNLLVQSVIVGMSLHPFHCRHSAKRAFG